MRVVHSHFRRGRAAKYKADREGAGLGPAADRLSLESSAPALATARTILELYVSTSATFIEPSLIMQ